MNSAPLNCGADLASSSSWKSIARPFTPDLINDMFGSDLSKDCFHSLSSHCCSHTRTLMSDFDSVPSKTAFYGECPYAIQG